MIGEIDDALRSLTKGSDGIPKDVEVAFDAPTKEWAARRNAPTIDLFLYDIREDVRRREYGWREQRDSKGVVTARTPAPRLFKLSYLVTAWTQRADDEHRLLDALLRCFLRYDAVPDELVATLLSDTGLPCSITIAQPPPEDRAFADVWSSLGGELKPSLDVVVTAPVGRDIFYAAGPPTEGIDISMDAANFGINESVSSGVSTDDRHA